MANQSQSPLPPLATAAAAAREEVRLWERDWTIPVSAHVEVEEGLGLEGDNGRAKIMLVQAARMKKRRNGERNEATDGEVTKNDRKETKAWWVICGN